MKKTIRPTALALSIAAIGAAFSLPAHAFKFDLENGAVGSFDSTISFGLQRRMKSPNASMIGNDNGGSVATTGDLGTLVNGAGQGATANPDFNYTNIDDGNLNYKKGDIVSAVLKGTHEMSLVDRGNWAMLGRFTWSSDFAANNTFRTPLDDSAKDAMQKNIALLDLWVSKDVKWADNSAKIKLGNQVINWGEDIFIMGGVNSINALDIRKAHIPGTQLKEIFIPAPMLSVNTSLAKGLSAEAYYQFMWNSFKLDPSGTYWSTADFLGAGGARGAFIPSSLGLGTPGDYDPRYPGRSISAITAAGGLVPVGKVNARDGGQFGLSLRAKPEGDTEYAAYYIRYHDKLPFVGFKTSASVTSNALNLMAVEQYGEDKDLFGLSANTKVGEWAIGAELSYRPRDSVAIDPTVPLSGNHSVWTVSQGTLVNGYVNEAKYQAHLTAFRFLPPSLTRALGAADGYVMAEAAYTRYPGLKFDGSVPYLLNDYTLPTKNSWGYVAELGLTYANIYNSGWTMSPIIDFYHDVMGTSPNTIPFVEGRKALAGALVFDYHNKWKVTVGYSTFFGGGNLNLMRDRDVASVAVYHSF